MSQRIKITVVVCAAILVGSAAWAQEGGVRPAWEGVSWEGWGERVAEWLGAVWPGEPEATAQATGDEGVVEAAPGGPGALDGGETCTPGSGWQGCAPDPNG